MVKINVNERSGKGFVLRICPDSYINKKETKLCVAHTDEASP